MLVLGCPIGEKIWIGDDIWIEVRTAHRGRYVGIAFHAPPSVKILRDHLRQADLQRARAALEDGSPNRAP